MASGGEARVARMARAVVSVFSRGVAGARGGDAQEGKKSTKVEMERSNGQRGKTTKLPNYQTKKLTRRREDAEEKQENGITQRH